MVRIGRMDSMHEDVKKISLAELAKQHAQKQYADHHQKQIEAVEHKVIISSKIFQPFYLRYINCLQQMISFLFYFRNIG